ncbi:MAG: hypothetical protein ISS36_03865 [Candidatus Aenigmarchaeota archaeon]|nr:hypothetical protein [Candidatus Aenigmarchaeota archaeon]
MGELIELNPGPTSPLPLKVGAFGTFDKRLSKESDRTRAQNIVRDGAQVLADGLRTIDGKPVEVVWSPLMVQDEITADQLARMFIEQGVRALVCLPDTWAWPQKTLLSFLAHFPRKTPIGLTCGNAGPKPGVVFAHASCGALAQSGILMGLNVGTWPDTGIRPKMTPETAEAMLDWGQAAITYTGLRGRRVVEWGHDSMGMETALAHVIPTRTQFGLEITRMDMKLLADLLQKDDGYDKSELKGLEDWMYEKLGDRIQIRDEADKERFKTMLKMYLIVRNIMEEVNAIGGGFMSQLPWGSDPRGTPLPVADAMESLFNSTFDHRGPKPPTPYATEKDTQGLLTMIFFTGLSGGGPPLFMDFRKVWEPWEIKKVAREMGIPYEGEPWAERGFVDGDNSGSASFDWAEKPGASPDECMARISMPQADPDYFPGRGNSVTFFTPGGVEGVAGRLAYFQPTDEFTLFWDDAETFELPEPLAEKVASTSTKEWPHTFVGFKRANMGQAKQFGCPANHFKLIANLMPARVEHFLDISGIRNMNAIAWPEIREGHRPVPLIKMLNGAVPPAP